MIKVNQPGGSKYVVRCGSKKVVIDIHVPENKVVAPLAERKANERKM